WNLELRIDAQIALRINREVGKEVLRILVDSVEPVGMRHVLHAGYGFDLVHVTEWQRVDKRNLLNHDQPLSPGDRHAGTERDPNGHQDSEKHERHKDR